MSQFGEKSQKSRPFIGFLKKTAVISMVMTVGGMTGYYATSYLDSSESLIAKFANIQIKSKLQIEPKKVSRDKLNSSQLKKTNQLFFAKTDVMHASDAMLVASIKKDGSDQQRTVTQSKTSYVTPAPEVIASLHAPQPSYELKPYPLPAQNSAKDNAQTIIIQPASLSLGKGGETGNATITLRASVAEKKPQVKMASLTPQPITPSSLMTRKQFRARTEARRLVAEKKCLAQAIYFEARGEPSLGQMAVANVVMNRVKSRHYPGSICGVVFQGQERRHKCQFSFACDGKTDRPIKNKHWRQAVRIAEQVMKGRKRIRALSNTLHYHADYVRPHWSRKMDRIKKIGRHIFFHDKSLKEKG